MARDRNIRMTVDASDVMAKLFRVGERVQDGSLKVMRKQAKEIQKLAKLNVPVEDFHVEDSIVIVEERSGVNRRTEIFVGVDYALLAELSGQDYNYAIWLHESMYNLGPLSELKNEISQSEDHRARVGNKYLERAFEEIAREIPLAVANEVKKDIR